MADLSLLSETERKEHIESLSLSQQIKHGYWPDYLSIAEICHLIYPSPIKPTDKNKIREWRSETSEINKLKRRLKEKLIQACYSDTIEYEGNIEGWNYFGENPYPLAKKGLVKPHIPDWSNSSYRDIPGQQLPQEYNCKTHDCTIHKDEFKRYFEWLKMPPPKNLLGWWEKENQNEPIKYAKPSSNATGTKEKELSKNQLQQIADLKDFIEKKLVPAAKAKKYELNVMELPFSKEMLHAEMQKRYNKTLWSSLSTFTDNVYKLDEVKLIFRVGGKHTHEEDFFKRILG